MAGIWKEFRRSTGEKGLEDEHGGDLVDDGGAVAAGGGAAAGMAGAVEEVMSLGGGEALVEQVDGEVGVLAAEGFSEGLGARGLRAEFAGEVQRVADDDDGDLVFAHEAGDGFEIGAKIFAVDRDQRLRGVAERVRESEADAAVADVEGEGTLRDGVGGLI